MQIIHALLKEEADPVTDVFSSPRAKFLNLIHMLFQKRYGANQHRSVSAQVFWVSINNLSFIIIAAVWLSLFQLLLIVVCCLKCRKLFSPNVEAQNKIKASIKNIVTTKMTYFILEKDANATNFLYTILYPFLGALVRLIWSGIFNYFNSTSSQYSNVHVHSSNLEQNQVPSPETTDNTHQ